MNRVHEESKTNGCIYRQLTSTISTPALFLLLQTPRGTPREHQVWRWRRFWQRLARRRRRDSATSRGLELKVNLLVDGRRHRIRKTRPSRGIRFSPMRCRIKCVHITYPVDCKVHVIEPYHMRQETRHVPGHILEMVKKRNYPSEVCSPLSATDRMHFSAFLFTSWVGGKYFPDMILLWSFLR